MNIDNTEVLKLLREIRDKAHAPGTCDELDRLEHRLYGNGQPGDIARLYDNQEKLQDSYNKLRLTIAFAAGGLAVDPIRYESLGGTQASCH